MLECRSSIDYKDVETSRDRVVRARTRVSPISMGKLLSSRGKLRTCIGFETTAHDVSLTEDAEYCWTAPLFHLVSFVPPARFCTKWSKFGDDLGHEESRPEVSTGQSFSIDIPIQCVVIRVSPRLRISVQRGHMVR